MLPHTRTRMKVIGLMGGAGCGKSTTRHAMFSLCGRSVRTVDASFASPLKNVCIDAFDLTHDQVHDGRLKETVDDRWGVTPRQIMQVVGTELFRERLPEALPELGLGNGTLWVKHMETRLDRLKKGPQGSDTLVIIDDVRFPDEVAMLRRHGAYILLVTREQAGSTAGAAGHSSERLDPAMCDARIDNSGSMEDLESQALAVLTLLDVPCHARPETEAMTKSAARQ